MSKRKFYFKCEVVTTCKVEVEAETALEAAEILDCVDHIDDLNVTRFEDTTEYRNFELDEIWNKPEASDDPASI